MNKDSNKETTQKRRAKKKNKKPMKIFLISLLLIVVTAGCAFGFYAYSITKKMNSKSEVESKDVKSGEPINFLLMGADAGDYTKEAKHQRSDTMMLIRFEPKSGNVYMLSIPRDTKVMINGKVQKINAAHAIGGPKLAIKTVENLLNVDINYYASISYAGFRECVDAIGGVDVVVPQDMHYNASDIKIHFKKGEQVHLNGEDAERFVRWRKNNDGTGYAKGDVGRAETQQEFMIKFFEKLKSPEGITKLVPLVNTVADNVETNMNLTTMMSVAKEAMDVNTANIHKEVLGGTEFYDKTVRTWYYLYDPIKSEAYLSHFRGVSGSSSSSANMNTQLNPENIRIGIYNATDNSGLASKYKDRLESLGYKVIKTGTSKEKKATTEIKYYVDDYIISGFKNYMKDVKFTKETKPNNEVDINIILGSDAVKRDILLGGANTDSYNQKHEGNNTSSVNKGKETVRILNSTSASGLASRYKEKLQKAGYNVVEVGNHNSNLGITKVEYKSDKALADRVVKELGTGNVSKDASSKSDITIILGNDVVD